MESRKAIGRKHYQLLSSSNHFYVVILLFFLTLVKTLALAIVLILVGKGLFDISMSTRCNYSFENIVQTYHEILGRDPEIQELKISVNGLLNGKWTVKSMRTILVNSREGIARKALLRSDGGKFRTYAQRKSTGHRPCACGDFYDEQLQRCFIMNPNIVLWFGGYGSDQDGTFVSSLAVRLKGTVSPSAMYKCRLRKQIRPGPKPFYV